MLVASDGAIFGLTMMEIWMRILTPGAVRTLSSGKEQPSRCPPTFRGKCVRSAFFESLKSLFSRTLKVLYLEASMTAWWLRAQARRYHKSKRTSTASLFATCRYGLVEYLEPLLKSFASNLELSQAAVAEHLPRPPRELHWSYGVIMMIGTHGQQKNVSWKETECPFCPSLKLSWVMRKRKSFAHRNRIR